MDKFNRPLILLAATGLGVSCVMTQLVLMREFLGAFGGNELVLGLTLGNWLFLSGAGAWLGRHADRLIGNDRMEANGDGTWPERNSDRINKIDRITACRTGTGQTDARGKWLCVGFIAMSWLPPALVFLLRVLRDAVFIRGAVAGGYQTLGTILAILAPYCLLTGFLLPLLCAALAGSREGMGNRRNIGPIYVADSLGSIAGGVLFSFVLIHRFDHFNLLLLPAGVNLALAALMAWQFGHKGFAVLTGVVSALALLCLPVLQLDLISTARQYQGQKILWRTNSPYGRLVITSLNGQVNVYENGQPVIASQQVDRMEETAHYAMAQLARPGRVLLVSGGVSGTAREILKYEVESLTYVELDPTLIAVGKLFFPQTLDDARIRVVATDGRLFIQQTREQFDLVILDVPDPSTTRINRFYTDEFFREVKRVLKPGGMVSLGLGHYENFISRPLARLLSSLHQTLRLSFSHVLMLPGGRVYFLASDRPPREDIAGLLEAKHIGTRLVKRSYLQATITPDRQADLQRAITEPASINRDFNPCLYYYHMSHWMSQHTWRFGLVGGVLLLIVIVYLTRLRATGLVVFASGFAASTLEVVLLLGFQILCGSLYYQVGVIVTIFMAGLASGAYLADRVNRHSKHRLALLAFVTGAFACVLPLIISGLGLFDRWSGFHLWVQCVIALLTFVTALLVSLQFVAASQLETSTAAATAARLYLTDYVGAGTGALLACACLLPVAGVFVTCLVTGVLCFAAAGVCAWKQ